MVQISGLRTLIAVADTGGVRPAAKRLGRTPSAVSMALKQLELELGAQLFEGDRKVRLTAFGQFAIEKAREVVRHFDGTCASLTAYARDEISRCNVASVTSVASVILPHAIFRVKQSFRNFEVNLRELHSIQLPDAVAEGIVDIGFGRVGPQRSDIEVVPLLTDAYDLVVSQDHELAKHDGPVPWSKVRKFDFIRNESFPVALSPEMTDIVENAHFNVSSTSSTFAMVSAKVGVTVLPRLCRRQAPLDVCFVPLEDPRAFRVVAALTKRDRRVSPATRKLIDAVRLVLAANEAELGYRSM
ncbi:LysR family transcriptional regulator [Rhodoligotrophos ferricapiens]|uniref:LysR family transcriptional regulator n=1 Tax=Rhodoligotrophos ferricapiens TaxID=3069264 RepID=UPI00315D7CEC